MVNSRAPLQALMVRLLIVLGCSAEIAGAQMLHDVKEIAVVPVALGNISGSSPRNVPVYASSLCLEKTTRDSLEAEALWLAVDQGVHGVSRVSFVCGPTDRMPQEHMVGFTFMSGGMWTSIEVSLHTIGPDGSVSGRMVFDYGLCGDPAIQGYLGPIGDPWGFVGFNMDCEDTYSVVYNFKTGTSTPLDSWGPDILEESNGVVELVWLKAEGIHYHSSDPLVVWKVFRGVESPELIDQQLSWTLVDDKPGVTLRIYRDYEARARESADRYPQAIL